MAALIGLGLATEWIEIQLLMAAYSLCLSLGLATEWIEITPRRHQSCRKGVSVLRPSGLKLFTRGHPNSRITGLGLATEWIEMVQGISINSLLPGLGLATEWIEIHKLYWLPRLPLRLGLATEWIEILIIL